jgi:pentatricopeptide repeat protein
VDLNEEKEQVMTKLLIQSLGIVEEELNEELPLGKQAVTYYLQQKYLNKLTKAGEFLFDPEHGSLWGKAFLFFRAGNFKDAFELLESMNEKDLILDI